MSNTATLNIATPVAWPPIDPANIRLRRRRDLRFTQIDSDRWNVLDTLTRRSFRVGLVEHWLLTHPDGRQTMRQLVAKLRCEFPTLAWSDESLLQTVATFRRNGLLASSTYEAPVSERGSFWQAWLGSVVVWQIRGVQPDHWLARMVPHTNGLFSAPAVRCWLALSFFTFLLVLLDFKRLSSQSLSLDWIMHPSTSGLLFLVFVVTRGLHELGHALVCKRFGVRCPDIGLFVILGAPCVYCDVSESWQLAHRWQRAAVAAAGMYVELIVATLAAGLWLTTVPGPVNTLALQTMLVCSISTVIINANPLMRFDGYYILADWLDEVNLRGKADSLAGGSLRGWLLGSLSTESPTRVPHQRFLLAFSLAGWIYRALLSVTIATVLVTMYTGWNLPWVGRFLATAILVSWWGVPAVKLSQDLIRTARQQRRGWRLSLLAAMLIVCVAILPLPSRRMASGWLQPSESQGVYASSTARLNTCLVRDGATVRAGQQLFELRNQELSTRLVRYEQAKMVAAIRLEANLRQRDMYSREIDVEHYQRQLEETSGWLSGVQHEMDSLTLTAPISGRLIAMTAPPANEPADGQLPSGSIETSASQGTAMMRAASWCDAQQSGRFVPEGCLLASVCGDRLLAVIPLNEQQLSNVAAGTQVRLRLAGQTRVLTTCTVKSVVQIVELASPWQAAALASLSDSASRSSSSSATHFAAVIELPSEVHGLPGNTVDAVFICHSTTLANLALRWMHANLRLFAD